MNEPDNEDLRLHFERQRARDESRAPSFPTMCARTTETPGAPSGGAHLLRLAWLAPAMAAVIGGFILLRPQPAPRDQYSERITALISELDRPAFAQSALPSDLLPPAFPQP
jgi:hypothetical protein